MKRAAFRENLMTDNIGVCRRVSKSKGCVQEQKTGWTPMGSKQLTHKKANSQKTGSWLSQSEIQGLRELGSVLLVI